MDGREGHTEIVKLLLAQPGVSVNVMDERRHTPLDWAVDDHHEATMAALQEAGGVRGIDLAAAEIQRIGRGWYVQPREYSRERVSFAGW